MNPRLCKLCQLPLNSREFWDNLQMHKDCLDRVIAAVRVTPAGQVEMKKEPA